ncbi:MAG: nuclear transport factor 2 family protein [Chitinispirillaceae bacterium]
MGEVQNVQYLKRAFDLMKSDDYEGFVEMCSSDVVWKYPVMKHVPYGGRWLGREQVLRFFKIRNESEDVVDFRPGEYVAQEDNVVALGFYRGHVIHNGRVWDSGFAHFVSFRNGRIQRYEAYFDTAAAVEAHLPQ